MYDTCTYNLSVSNTFHSIYSICSHGFVIQKLKKLKSCDSLYEYDTLPTFMHAEVLQITCIQISFIP